MTDRMRVALEWICDQPTSPNDPRPQADWWSLRDAALWGLGQRDNPPVLMTAAPACVDCEDE